MQRHTQKRSRRGCWRRTLGCVFLVILLVLTCGGLLLLVRTASAEAGRAVYLLIDQSSSVFHQTDPQGLRMDAARLFITYLGLGEDDLTHAAGVIYFGATAETIASLTPLGSDAERAALLARLAQPAPRGWTDQAAALELALNQIETAPDGRAPAILLFTDGIPQWEPAPSAAAQAAYSTRLRQISAQLAQARIPVFIILLADTTADSEPSIEAAWRSIWQAMSQAAPPGDFFIAREAGDLAAIYHEIAAALTGRQAYGRIIDVHGSAAGLQEAVLVADDLAQITFIISTSDPQMQVTLIQPDGQQLLRDASGVAHRTSPTEQIWRIPEPQPGVWRLAVTGQGRLQVWQDVRPRPTSFPPSPRPVRPTAHPTATPWPTVTPTATPQPISIPAAISTAPSKPASTVVSPTTMPATAVDQPPQRLHTLFWLLPPLGFGAAWGAWRRRARQPLVTGVLRIVAGPGAAEGRAVVDLDGLRRRRIVVGAAPADLILLNAQAQIVIAPGMRVGDVHEMLVSGGGDTRLNGRRLHTPTRLEDTALIELGEHRLRYENLRWRHAARTDAWRQRSARHLGR
jgi:hypothetical protein